MEGITMNPYHWFLLSIPMVILATLAAVAFIAASQRIGDRVLREHAPQPQTHEMHEDWLAGEEDSDGSDYQ